MFSMSFCLQCFSRSYVFYHCVFNAYVFYVSFLYFYGFSAHVFIMSILCFYVYNPSFFNVFVSLVSLNEIV